MANTIHSKGKDSKEKKPIEKQKTCRIWESIGNESACKLSVIEKLDKGDKGVPCCEATTICKFGR